MKKARIVTAVLCGIVLICGFFIVRSYRLRIAYQRSVSPIIIENKYIEDDKYFVTIEIPDWEGSAAYQVTRCTLELDGSPDEQADLYNRLALNTPYMSGELKIDINKKEAEKINALDQAGYLRPEIFFNDTAMMEKYVTLIDIQFEPA